MLIILEGPDGAGKSTLAREIADLIGQHAEVEIRHAGPLTEHPLDAYEVPLANYRPGTKHIICDRWHLGEAVYPQIFNRPTLWDGAIAEHVNLFMQSRGACVILLDPKITELRLRYTVRGDDLVKKHQLEWIAGIYRALPAHYVSRTYGANETPIPRQIVQLARNLHIAATALNQFETYVGPPNPHVLLLGDERATAARLKQPDLPAFAPYASTSGHYLLDHLIIGSMWRVGIANACDVDDAAELWETLGRPRVVTLGNRAHECVARQGIPHGAVPHPQFVRRFYHKHGAEYASVIKNASLTHVDRRSWRPS